MIVMIIWLKEHRFELTLIHHDFSSLLNIGVCCVPCDYEEGCASSCRPLLFSIDCFGLSSGLKSYNGKWQQKSAVKNKEKQVL